MITLATRRTLAFCLLLLAALVASCRDAAPPVACVDSLGCVAVAPGEPVRIGVLQALSGKIAPLGQAQVRGLELALAERDNSLLGHTISLQLEDTGCTPEGGANSALKLIADPRIVAIYGTTCSSAAATASEAMSAAGLTMISGNNSAPFLTAIAGQAAPAWQAGYFRTAPNEESAGLTAAHYVFHQLGLRKAATINDNDIYTKGLTDSFRQAFADLGGEIVLEAAVNKGEKEMGPVLQAVIASQAEVLFFPLFQPEGGLLLREARALPALDPTRLITGGALIEQGFLDEVGDLGRGLCFVSPSNLQGAGVNRLAAAYETTYREKPTVNYYLSGYDAASLLLHAIEQAARPQLDGSLSIGRQALRDALYRTTGFAGVTGTLNCTRFGDCAAPAFDILRLDEPAKGLAGLQANIVFSSRSPQ